MKIISDTINDNMTEYEKIRQIYTVFMLFFICHTISDIINEAIIYETKYFRGLVLY